MEEDNLFLFLVIEGPAYMRHTYTYGIESGYSAVVDYIEIGRGLLTVILVPIF